jgi:DNA-binding transcriptional regulator LsrR (DeoR family)
LQLTGDRIPQADPTSLALDGEVLPADGRALVHAVARLHYVSDLSQVEIARKLGVSSATISRLLRRARDEGIVRIEVADFVSPDTLGAELARRLGLRAVRIIDAPATALPAALAAPLGQMLAEAAPPAGAAIAIGWGRAVRAVLGAGLPPLPGTLIVPATGGLQQHEPHFQINEFARQLAEQLGGTPHFLHAPNMATAGVRDLLLADPDIATVLRLWDRLDIAILGIGLAPSAMPPGTSVATPAEHQLANVAGDVIRHYFDPSGNIVAWEGAARMIAVSPDQLARARLSIGVASGPAKAAAILGAAAARLISALVTDAQTAAAVIALCDGRPPPP